MTKRKKSNLPPEDINIYLLEFNCGIVYSFGTEKIYLVNPQYISEFIDFANKMNYNINCLNDTSELSDMALSIAEEMSAAIAKLKQFMGEQNDG